MMRVLHQSRGKGNAAAKTLGETMSASRLAKQPEDGAAIEQIHDISQRPQFSGLSGELGVASSQLPIQAKLTIGQPNDRYEQEADQVAKSVVQRINTPQTIAVLGQDAAQMQADTLQSQETEQAELQLKRESGNEIVQRREAIGGGEASTDLEASINSARGGGKAITDNHREPMEQAFGADFREVKVHTDGQSDQLNRSIQARAFTTGQDVFFRLGEYNPGSRGGQELLAHELTHVVQQKGETARSGEEINRMLGMGSGDEERANKKVQESKGKVDVVEAGMSILNWGTTTDPRTLQKWKGDLERSIKYRQMQKALPNDGGKHQARVAKEVGWLGQINAELARIDNLDRIARNNASASASAPIPLRKGGTWGKQ